MLGWDYGEEDTDTGPMNNGEALFIGIIVIALLVGTVRFCLTEKEPLVLKYEKGDIVSMKIDPERLCQVIETGLFNRTCYSVRCNSENGYEEMYAEEFEIEPQRYKR